MLWIGWPEDMIGYTALVTSTVWEQAAFDSPEPQKTLFRQRAMNYCYESAKDENERRKRGDKPDDRHLTYL